VFRYLLILNVIWLEIGGFDGCVLGVPASSPGMVVSTFWHQLAHNETPQIMRDAELELLHAQDVAAHFLQAEN